MKRKIFAMFLVLALVLSLGACGQSKETTVTGMVVSVNGTVITLMEMDESVTSQFSEGQIPSMPEGFEGFSGSFNGTMPEGGSFPGWNGSSEMPSMPEGGSFPGWNGSNEMPSMPEGGSFPGWNGSSEMPQMPEGGSMPQFPSGDRGNMTPDFGNITIDGETQEIDLANAHISVEIDGGKEGGSMENITPGAFVTVTLDGKGKATYVLVSQTSGFGSFGNFGGFSGFGGFGSGN